VAHAHHRRSNRPCPAWTCRHHAGLQSQRDRAAGHLLSAPEQQRLVHAPCASPHAAWGGGARPALESA